MAGNSRNPTPSGQISMSDINTALGQGTTTAIDFNDARVRFLSNQDSGSVSMNNMRNKFYSDGTVGPIQYSSSKGSSNASGPTSPVIFGGNSFARIRSNITPSTQNRFESNYFSLDPTFAGRTWRVQVNGQTRILNNTLYTFYSGYGYGLQGYSGTGESIYITQSMAGGTYSFKIASY